MKSNLAENSQVFDIFGYNIGYVRRKNIHPNSWSIITRKKAYIYIYIYWSCIDRKGRKLNARKEERGERARRIFEMVSADLGLICSTFLRQGVTSLGPMSGVGRLVSARDEAAAASMVAASCLASFLPLKHRP